jgi:hypothetical protein
MTEVRSLTTAGAAVVRDRDGAVVLVTSNAISYTTKAPSEAQLSAILNSVDPCYLFIEREIVG